MIKAGMALYSVAITAMRGVSAIAGNRASPSFDIAFPISAENGIYPFKYNVAVKICGPHPGIKPTKIAIKGVSGKITLNNCLKSNPVK